MNLPFALKGNFYAELFSIGNILAGYITTVGMFEITMRL